MEGGDLGGGEGLEEFEGIGESEPALGGDRVGESGEGGEGVATGGGTSDVEEFREEDEDNIFHSIQA